MMRSRVVEPALLIFLSSQFLIYQPSMPIYGTDNTMIEVNGRSVDWREGMTISDLLDEIRDTHPYPVVRIGDRYVSRPNFEKTTVPDGSKVFLIPMIAGG